MQTLSPNPPKAKGTDKTKELRKRIDDSIDMLANAVDEVRMSAIFKAYLDVQAKFHRYSWCNTLLIYSQKPEATNVAGFQTWKKLDRHVRKGEHGIMIFAPCPWKRENDKGEDESGVYFKAVHVFDVSQTDGEELPSVDVPVVGNEANKLLIDLERVCLKRGLSVDYHKLDMAFGIASRDGKIEIDNSHQTGQQAKTLAHEIAHHALHFDKSVCPKDMTRETAELEAESVAYVVCKHFNLDTSIRSSRYIALWQGDSKALRESLERISKTARAIIDDVDSLDSSPVPCAPGKAVA